jgi:ribosomal protein S18 acetylase RimI-like enzyme
MVLIARSVTLVDSNLILKWRNQESSVKFSASNVIIKPKEHEEWFENRIVKVEEQAFWIFSDGEKQLGYVRFDSVAQNQNTYEISICIDQNYQNIGYGKKILDMSLDMHFEVHPLSQIVAKVHFSNLASLALFQKKKFETCETIRNFLIMKLRNRKIRFVFRSDATNEIGAGHTQRSLGLIQELIRFEYDVIFIGNTSEIPWVTKQLESLGFKSIFHTYENFRPNNKTDVLILDSYTEPINSVFINKLNWLLVVVIHDSATPLYDGDILIHLGISSDPKVNFNGKILSGLKYLPLRKSIEPVVEQISNSKLNVTVIGGGVDQNAFASELSRYLTTLAGDFTVNIFTNQPEKIAPDIRFKTFEFGNHLDDIGNNSNLVFCTSSFTALEFIARGCAVGVCCSTFNQKEYYDALPKLGIAKPIGSFISNEWQLDLKQISLLMSSDILRKQLSKKSLELCDFYGVPRIIESIFSFGNKK